MTSPVDFDRQLRAMAHTALDEMSATPPVERRVLTPRRRSVSPLAVALAVAAAVAIAVPLVASHSLHGRDAQQPQHEDTKPAGTILRDMTDAMTHLRSYHMIIAGATVTGAPITAEIQTDRAGGLAETITSGGQTDHLVVSHGTLYIKGPNVVPQAWQSAAGDHWVRMPASDYATMAEAFISPGHVMDCLTGTPGQLSTAGVQTVHGMRAVHVVSTRTDATTTGFTLDVAATGAPYALHLESSDGPNSRPGCQAPASTGQMGIAGFPGNETIDFDQFNSPAPVNVPADVVDAAALPQLTH
jgi:hypothetical protein